MKKKLLAGWGYAEACQKRDHYGRWPNGISKQIEARLWNRNIQSDLLHTAVLAALTGMILLEAFAGRILTTCQGRKLSTVSYTGELGAERAVGQVLEELPKVETARM